MSDYGFSIPTSGYDSEDRLVNYNRTSGLNQSWSLSTVGDWNSVTTNGTSQARTHGPTHELTAVEGNAVSTDVKGNIGLIPSAARPTSTALGLTWGMDNRLKSADVGNNGSAEVTYQFDALGRRVARTASGTTTVYVQSGQQTIADYTAGANSSSPLYRYVYGSYIDEPVLRYQPTGAQSVYYHRNQQYSVTALTSASGAILERYAYTAYGTPTITNASGTVLTSSTQNNRYTYTGREWEETISLYHYRARMYDSTMGRFCSKDPIGYEDGLNPYRYVFCRPISFLDPSGLETFHTDFEDGAINLAEWHILGNRVTQPGIRLHFNRTPFDGGAGCGEINFVNSQTIGASSLVSKVGLVLPFFGKLEIGTQLDLNYIAVPDIVKTKNEGQCVFADDCGRIKKRPGIVKEITVDVHRDWTAHIVIGSFSATQKVVGKIGSVTEKAGPFCECDPAPSGFPNFRGIMGDDASDVEAPSR